jgi:antirestriction protein ArdC
MTAATRSRKPARKPARKRDESPRFDAYQVITDQVIALLDAGTAPWQKPWKHASYPGGVSSNMPRSLSTGRAYRGVNILLLAMSAAANGYASPWWGTYEQIAERGGQVRKGETGTLITFWKRIKIEDEATGELKWIPLLRVFKVFNAEQSEDGLRLPRAATVTATTSEDDGASVGPIEACDAAVAAYLETGPTLVIGGDRACYSPALDQVRMPERDRFVGAEEYYGTLFHELTHSTGHAERLARKDLLSFHNFGDVSYSREELVAEMGAAFLSGLTGVAAVTLPNSAAYLQSWIDVLRGDKKLLATAAAQAQKAADLILGVTFEDPAE